MAIHLLNNIQVLKISSRPKIVCGNLFMDPLSPLINNLYLVFLEKKYKSNQEVKYQCLPVKILVYIFYFLNVMVIDSQETLLLIRSILFHLFLWTFSCCIWWVITPIQITLLFYCIFDWKNSTIKWRRVKDLSITFFCKEV